MFRRLIPLAGACALTVCTVFASPIAAQEELDQDSGSALYARFCASCHGAAGRGDGPVAASLGVAVPDLTLIARDRGGEFPADEVREIIDGRFLVITHGPRNMPVWGYRFWVDEGADIRAEERARSMVQRLVDHVRLLQDRSDPRFPRTED